MVASTACSTFLETALPAWLADCSARFTTFFVSSTTLVTVLEKAVEATKEQAQKVANSVEDFAANLGGLPLDRAKTFYDEGIKSASDFKNWTEKELLALKGIGPATIKKLKEHGISFK